MGVVLRNNMLHPFEEGCAILSGVRLFDLLDLNLTLLDLVHLFDSHLAENTFAHDEVEIILFIHGVQTGVCLDQMSAYSFPALEEAAIGCGVSTTEVTTKLKPIRFINGHDNTAFVQEFSEYILWLFGRGWWGSETNLSIRCDARWSLDTTRSARQLRQYQRRVSFLGVVWDRSMEMAGSSDALGTTSHCAGTAILTKLFVERFCEPRHIFWLLRLRISLIYTKPCVDELPLFRGVGL